MTTHELKDVLKALEVALHQPERRGDAHFAGKLLHDDFVEFGSSGQAYDKARIMDYLVREEPAAPIRVWSQDYQLQVQNGQLCLLLYKSAHIGAEGSLSGHALRSSVWLQTGEGWQMIFHQGTPMAPFDVALVNESQLGVEP
ncbi:hypothetical protein SAMN02745857_03419 [Andreprevotia lacus DSM 23236]|jgi:hypothetical protein|uniref:DUF4440 domain-containing protein n=1 Tax=Andreprevotia lacus DSM 23236 TaxID=1121001 RepID=A0A1W1XXX2_9NEIS|nr:nuclear transport factor 2 family protein [Andreprevotia lacus]SMC28800.1 hypothetical protein SAMN02745857_03419 [Andreprevotia lacus DSM 23236]